MKVDTFYYLLNTVIPFRQVTRCLNKVSKPSDYLLKKVSVTEIPLCKFLVDNNIIITIGVSMQN